MFSKSYKAKMREAKLIVREDKTGERHKSCELTLQYPFDEKLAEGIGGHAVAVQQMLASGNCDLSSLSGGRLRLDVKDVKITFSPGNDKVEIEQTTALRAVVKTASAEEPNPVLTCKARFDLDEQGAIVDYIWNNLDAVVSCRMDRRQLDLTEQ